MKKFSVEVLEGLKKKVLSREADIIIIQKGNTKKFLIIVSQNNLKWEIFNGSNNFLSGIQKAAEILGISDKDILGSTNINYSIFSI